MELEMEPSQAVQVIMVNTAIIWDMEKEHITLKHKVNAFSIKVIGKKINKKEKVNFVSKMADHLKGSSKMIREMAQVLWNRLMGKSSNKEFGKMMN